MMRDGEVDVAPASRRGVRSCVMEKTRWRFRVKTRVHPASGYSAYGAAHFSSYITSQRSDQRGNGDAGEETNVGARVVYKNVQMIFFLAQFFGEAFAVFELVEISCDEVGGAFACKMCQ